MKYFDQEHQISYMIFYSAQELDKNMSILNLLGKCGCMVLDEKKNNFREYT